jgi:hypothetical protein
MSVLYICINVCVCVCVCVRACVCVCMYVCKRIYTGSDAGGAWEAAPRGRACKQKSVRLSQSCALFLYLSIYLHLLRGRRLAHGGHFVNEINVRPGLGRTNIPRCTRARALRSARARVQLHVHKLPQARAVRGSPTCTRSGPNCSSRLKLPLSIKRNSMASTALALSCAAPSAPTAHAALRRWGAQASARARAPGGILLPSPKDPGPTNAPCSTNAPAAALAIAASAASARSTSMVRLFTGPQNDGKGS